MVSPKNPIRPGDCLYRRPLHNAKPAIPLKITPGQPPVGAIRESPLLPFS